MQQFEREAAKICQALSKLEREGDNSILKSFPLIHWELRCPGSSEGCGEGTFPTYLYHPAVILEEASCDGDANGSEIDELTQQYDEGANEIASEYLEDDSVLVDAEGLAKRPGRDRCFRVNFSIIFSETYAVPVLYFHAQDMNGSPHCRSKVLQWLAPFSQLGEKHRQGDLDEEASWEFVSQEQHPVTGIPSYFLHPCQTAERMALLTRIDPAFTTKTTTLVAKTEKKKPLDLWSWMSMILPAVRFAIPSKLFQAVVDETTQMSDSYR